MIELNLLPPDEKQTLRLEQTRRWIMFYGGSLLLVLAGFIALLGFIWFFILIQLKSYSQSLQSIENSFQGQSLDHQKDLIADFNLYLEKLNWVQKTQKNYSPVLAEIARIIPPGVRLNSLSIDETGLASLSGFAAQRTQVLALQDALEKSKLFSNLEKPLTNLTKQTNIDFHFSFSVQSLKSDD